MKKNIYMQPELKVVELKAMASLLSGSPVNNHLQGEQVDEAW